MDDAWWWFQFINTQLHHHHQQQAIRLWVACCSRLNWMAGETEQWTVYVHTTATNFQCVLNIQSMHHRHHDNIFENYESSFKITMRSEYIQDNAMKCRVNLYSMWLRMKMLVLSCWCCRSCPCNFVGWNPFRPRRPLTSSSSNQGPIRMSDGLMMIVMACHLCGAWVW